jgi:hypothetical protein
MTVKDHSSAMCGLTKAWRNPAIDYFFGDRVRQIIGMAAPEP